MGTSAPTPGTGSGTPLVPSWLEEPAAATPLPGGEEQTTPSDGTSGDGSQDGQDSGTSPPLPPPADGKRFRNARTNFSRFAGSGGSDHGALRRAVRDYVRTSVGGRENAVRRMAPSRDAASSALGLFRGLQRDGVHETLRRLDLQDFSGRSIQSIFTGLTEVICKNGALIDEAIARDAWLETIAELDQFGINDLDALTEDQVRELFLNFVARSIEVRLYQEIGVKSFKLCDDLNIIESFDEQFRDYIERSVQDSFSGDLSKLSNMSDDDITRIVDSTYSEAWMLLQELGDQE